MACGKPPPTIGNIVVAAIVDDNNSQAAVLLSPTLESGWPSNLDPGQIMEQGRMDETKEMWTECSVVSASFFLGCPARVLRASLSIDALLSVAVQ